MKINRIVPILMLALALFLSACQAEEPAAAPEVQPSTPAYTLAEGMLMPVRYTDLAFTAAGRVAEILVSEGEAVTAGQVLARLELVNREARTLELKRAEQELLAAQLALETLRDPEAASQRIAQAQFDLANLEQQIALRQEELDDENALAEPDLLLVSKLEAQIELLNTQAASTQALLDTLGTKGIDPDALAASEARFQTAQASLAAAQAALQPVELVAPWDGTLASLDLVLGQVVSAGLPVASLADFSSWVVLTDNLTELEVVGVEPGQQVSLTLDALPEVSLVGTVESIASRYELKRGDITYTVTIALDALDERARWGMTAAIRWER
ncbi:MAG: HlyD family efflux transporter periplasmic adaptor subunit [Anaerolineales bacterium]|jgi:multidrug resistance efflux pump|nr:HlyD family efflux transporter periplasmic adaptor subunit [Anaerolineales bacterium]